jgi:hypothetical protein
MNSFGRGSFSEREFSDLTKELSSFVELPLYIEPRRDCNIAQNRIPAPASQNQAQNQG